MKMFSPQIKSKDINICVFNLGVYICIIYLMNPNPETWMMATE